MQSQRPSLSSALTRHPLPTTIRSLTPLTDSLPTSPRVSLLLLRVSWMKRRVWTESSCLLLQRETRSICDSEKSARSSGRASSCYTRFSRQKPWHPVVHVAQLVRQQLSQRGSKSLQMMLKLAPAHASPPSSPAPVCVCAPASSCVPHASPVLPLLSSHHLGLFFVGVHSPCSITPCVLSTRDMQDE